MTIQKSKRLISLTGIAIFLGIVVFTFPYAYSALRTNNATTFLPYTPSTNVAQTSPAEGDPAIAVPVLLFHGVVEAPDNDNTSRDAFIKDMEALKLAGYQTITLKQFENFYSGTLTLPAKPVLITFDDGRKDSYYPTDQIFQQLGFTAVMFEVTGPIFKGDDFFLSWDELTTVRDNPRWEIGAHGRYSHEHIPIDEKGTDGRFFSSRIYDPETGLESIEDYEKRVEQDYVDGINDLKDHLDITPEAFAVPLNDYGQLPLSNYADSGAFNHEMVQKYFKYAFIESLTYDPNQLADYTDPKHHWNLYNYANDDPYSVVRIEPKEMDADVLLSLLDRFAPTQPDLALSKDDPSLFRNSVDVQYGAVTSDADGLHITPSENGTAARATIGNTHWQNYLVDADVIRSSGRSAVLQVYAKDQDHAVSIGFSDNGVYLHEIKGGTDADEVNLVPEQIIGLHNGQVYHIHAEIKNQQITVTVDGNPLFTNVPIESTQGAIGFKVWDPLPLHAEAVIQSLTIKPLTS